MIIPQQAWTITDWRKWAIEQAIAMGAQPYVIEYHATEILEFVMRDESKRDKT